MDRVRRDPNALTALRLALAAAVLVAHCWPLGGVGGTPTLGGEDLGAFAVAGFFVISGYLITGSRLSLSLPRFAWHRALRIYPAFWVALLVVPLAFAPVTALLTGTHVDMSSAASYVTSNASMRIGQWSIAGPLPGLPYTPGGAGPWNGSLWTLYYEWLCYLIAGAWLSIPGIRRRAAFTCLAFGMLTAGSILHLYAAPDYLLTLGTYFAAGAALRMSDSVIPLDGRLAVVAAAAALAITARTDGVPAALPLAYVLIWASSRAPARFKGWRHDYSYGVYVYAFPVQQVAASLGVQRFGFPVFMVASALAVAPFAIASWWLVERPAMRMRGATLRRSTGPRRAPSPSAPFPRASADAV